MQTASRSFQDRSSKKKNGKTNLMKSMKEGHQEMW